MLGLGGQATTPTAEDAAGGGAMTNELDKGEGGLERGVAVGEGGGDL